MAVMRHCWSWQRSSIRSCYDLLELDMARSLDTCAEAIFDIK